jgi:hypothetical protein
MIKLVEDRPGLRVYEFEIDLTAVGASEKLWIDTIAPDGTCYDACSIQCTNPATAGGFNTGVIGVKRSNSKQLGTVDMASPLSISLPGFTYVSGATWLQVRYLVLECTTASSPATKIIGAIVLKKLGFSPT